jgi:hypothetical protein
MLPPPKPTTSAERSFVLPQGCTEVLHLMGVSRLADFLAFAQEHTNLDALSGAGGDSVMMELAESWRDAARAFEALEASDPYPVEPPQVFPIPASMREHCNALLAQPQVQREFDRVPIALGMVPLAPLICAKQRIGVSAGLLDVFAKAHLADEMLVTTCLPLQPPSDSVQVAQRTLRQGEGSVMFTSDSDDLRVLPPVIVGTDALSGVWPGRIQRTLAISAGYSTNLFNVIRYEDRMLLNNGFQRAHAMFRRGVTHVPAIIQVCRHWEDVVLVGSPEMVANKAVYFERGRPPMLKDFSDRRLAVSLAVPARRKFVRINYQVETGYFAV